ncbi:unnamed protein product [Rodentolepis nana]|uniref:Uncharacterized protein n=1 Tax=Rodentolepis nana TaxID=102285 RepID=A0A0R3TDW0_RODNA|nr:unnamed protein product [Rodentolepis nana]
MYPLPLTSEFEDQESMRDAIATRMNHYDTAHYLPSFLPFLKVQLLSMFLRLTHQKKRRNRVIKLQGHLRWML